MNSAEALIKRCRVDGRSVAVAESLTGGLLGATLTAVPGASDVFLGGAITYATSLKSQLLGVDELLLAAKGPVCEEVAGAMATGIRSLVGASVGLSTTGVAGPASQGNALPGNVFVAVSHAATTEVRQLQLVGSRSDIRQATVDWVIELANEVLGNSQ